MKLKVNKFMIMYDQIQDKDENGLLGIATNNCDLAQKGLNKENTVKPGPWTKPKKTRSKVPKPVSTIDFEGQLHHK